eukprot:735887-Amphidinium_carterae.3
MGRPAGGVKSEVLCLDHNLAQRSALQWLSMWVRQQCPPSQEWSISFPRGRGLHEVLGSLGEDRSYCRESISTPGDNCEATSTGTESKWIDAENASLPSQSAKVDLQAILPPELYALLSLSVPGMLDKPASSGEQEVRTFPPLFMKVRDWHELSALLVQSGLCCLGADDRCPVWGSRHLRAGVFGVAKPDSDKVRMIIDRRRKNATEISMRTALH